MLPIRLSLFFAATMLLIFSLNAHPGHDHSHNYDLFDDSHSNEEQHLDAHEESSSNSGLPKVSTLLVEKTFEEHLTNATEEPGTVVFTPPKGWQLADSNMLPKNVKAMVVGNGETSYPPSINLGTEKFSGTLKDYLKIVKSLNEAKRAEWKDLGKIRTESGNASLSQVDIKTEWGIVRMMHVILVKDGSAYILTSAALKDEFPKFYKEFFAAMRSLHFNEDTAN